jgi:hypothetical protein
MIKKTLSDFSAKGHMSSSLESHHALGGTDQMPLCGHSSDSPQNRLLAFFNDDGMLPFLLIAPTFIALYQLQLTARSLSSVVYSIKE